MSGSEWRGLLELGAAAGLLALISAKAAFLFLGAAALIAVSTHYGRIQQIAFGGAATAARG